MSEQCDSKKETRKKVLFFYFLGENKKLLLTKTGYKMNILLNYIQNSKKIKIKIK